MRICLSYILIAIFGFTACSAWGQGKEAQPLPNVLVIGDKIYHQHARGVAKALRGKADVTLRTELRVVEDGESHEPVVNSRTALAHLDRLLGRVDRNGEPVAEDKWPVWDLIHVNVGLGDLVYRAPDMDAFRLLPIHAGGVVATGPKQYERNLVELVKRLKQKVPGARLVWAHTTPIRASRSNVFKPGSEIEYNRIAERVMNRHRVPINDMHAYAKSIMDMDRPAPHGWDPFHFDKKPIHMPIVRVIEQAFGLKPMPETEEEKAVKKAQKRPAPAQG